MHKSPTSRALAQILLATIAMASAVRAADVSMGACDGSAIVDVGDGHFLNATDEDNVIRLYKRGVAEPVRQFPLSGFLKTEENKRGEPKEADIEAVARIGNRLYWIGSHGNNRNGNRETSRDRLFATTQTGQGATTRLAPVGSPFTGLLRSFAKLGDPLRQTLERAQSLAPETGGLNIEGLAAARDNQLLIGFRSPLIEGKALILPLLNPADVVDKGDEPSFGEPALLPLDNRGIRAIEPKAGTTGTGYWLLAGPSGDVGRFTLYEWQIGSAPTPVPGVVLSGAHGAPEGLMVDGSGRVFVSWDGGSVEGCKDRAVDARSFVVELVKE